MTCRILGSVVLFVALSVKVFCQDSSQVRPNSLQADKWALQFQISNNFTLASFEGATISIKKQTSPQNALRLGLTVYSSASWANSGNYDNENIVAYFNWIYYPTKNTEVNPFYGFGPLMSYYRSHASDGSLYSNWGAGMIGLLGVEWFLNRSISTTAEYSTSASYIRYTSSSAAASNVFFFNSTVRFGLSAYF